MLEIITFTYNSCTKEDFQRFEIIFCKNTTLIVTADGHVGLLRVSSTKELKFRSLCPVLYRTSLCIVLRTHYDQLPVDLDTH